MMLIFIVLSIFSTTYGYLINDLADKKLDEQHGKENTFKQDRNLKAVLIVLLFFIISILFALPFRLNPYFTKLYILWLFISTFYSLPPLRFKERGKMGLLLVVLAQRVIPILLLFAALNFWQLPEIIIISVYILFRGLSSDINHQLSDYENDLRTGTKTSAVELGKDRLEKVFQYFLNIEKVLLLAVLFTLFLKYFTISYPGFILFLFPFILYFLMYIFSIKIQIDNKNLDIVNPYRIENKNVFQILHQVFPNILLPFLLLIYLLKQNIYFFIFIGLYFVFYQLYRPETIKKSFLGKLISQKILNIVC